MERFKSCNSNVTEEIRVLQNNEYQFGEVLKGDTEQLQNSLRKDKEKVEDLHKQSRKILC